MPDYELERRLAEGLGDEDQSGFGPDLSIAGVDEAGRGPWAGPVVAAAVTLDLTRLPASLIERLDDSKAVTPLARAEICEQLLEQASVGRADIGLGRAEVEEIDSLNILEATMTAMARAVAALAAPPLAVLVDGNRLPKLNCPAKAVVKGDSRSLSIAAASIVAKVQRDREMETLAASFPGYGWEKNRGYGTADHKLALKSLGVTPQHRRSFRPVREALGLA